MDSFGVVQTLGQLQASVNFLVELLGKNAPVGQGAESDDGPMVYDQAVLDLVVRDTKNGLVVGYLKLEPNMSLKTLAIVDDHLVTKSAEEFSDDCVVTVRIG